MQRKDLIDNAVDRFKTTAMGAPAYKKAMLNGCITDAINYYGHENFQIVILQSEIKDGDLHMEVFFEAEPRLMDLDKPIDYSFIEMEEV